uniref:Uncharacterized protein n=1 Tax=Terrapene triunguis TaxID=2587831 RepID=A0A674IKE0_9SAUR
MAALEDSTQRLPNRGVVSGGKGSSAFLEIVELNMGGQAGVCDTVCMVVLVQDLLLWHMFSLQQLGELCQTVSAASFSITKAHQRVLVDFLYIGSNTAITRVAEHFPRVRGSLRYPEPRPWRLLKIRP